MNAPRIFSIGHSTRSVEVFTALLRAHGVTGLADVRAVPKSRRHPHFSREALQVWAPAHGITYRHFAALGGMRSPRPDSSNGGWRNDAFRGYADHMQTPIFTVAVDELLAFGSTFVIAVMCAEAKWWECHRQLLADALVARGVEVRHIMSATDAPPHDVTPFARFTGHEVTYPALV
jgi:uncharacterized protein (DUF488 family)